MTACATCGSTTRNQHCPTCGLPAATTTTATQAAVPGTAFVPPAAGPVQAAAPAAAGPAYGQAKLVGDARPLGGMPISRMLNGLCYVITGIALFVVAGQGAPSGWVAVLIGLGALGYGAKIWLTRTSYWITSVVYLAPIFAIGWAITSMSN